MDFDVDNIYEPILTGVQLQVILSSVCNLLHKRTLEGVRVGTRIYACVYIYTYLQTRSPYQFYSEFSLSSFFICLFIH